MGGMSRGKCMSVQILPFSLGRTSGSGNELGMSFLHKPESKLTGWKETTPILPPASFVNCQIISAFTFPWVNLGLIIMPLPVMRPIVRLTQVWHQMADCFAKHKCYKTANLCDICDIMRVFSNFSMAKNHLKAWHLWTLHPEIPILLASTTGIICISNSQEALVLLILRPHCE